MIAFICHPYHRGGVTRWMVDMALAYAQNSTRVFFITVNPVKPFSSGGKETVVELLGNSSNVELVISNVGWEFEFGTEDYRAHVYASLLSRNVPKGIPVIMSDDPSVWKVSSFLPNVYKFVGVLHADEKYYYDIADRYKSFVNIWVAVSQRVRRELQRNAAFNSININVIPCGIFLPAERPVAVSGISCIKMLFVGRLNQYQKRVFDLLKIAAELKSKAADFHLTIIGDGKDRKQLEQETYATELNNQVEFKGWLSKAEVLSYLYQSDILLLTSDFEGMPIAVMEGLCAGCAIVSTKVSGVEDLKNIENADNCLWLNDVGDISNAVKNILSAIKVPVANRIQAARHMAEQEFSIQTCMNRYDVAIAKENIFVTSIGKKRLSIVLIMYSYILAAGRRLKMSCKIKQCTT